MSHSARSIQQAAASLRRYAGEYLAHEHAHAQVLVGLNGRLELELGGKLAYIDAASALIVPAGVAHGYLADSSADVLVIDSPMRKGLERFRRFVPPAHWKDTKHAFDASAAIDEVAGASTLLLRRPIDLVSIDAAIDREPHADWSSARLAALCRLSVQRFHPRFVELTGLTPGAYVRQRRLDAAQRLLRAGLSLEATALQVGYASASALGYALRRERGVGARALRSG